MPLVMPTVAGVSFDSLILNTNNHLGKEDIRLCAKKKKLLRTFQNPNVLCTFIFTTVIVMLCKSEIQSYRIFRIYNFHWLLLLISCIFQHIKRLFVLKRVAI